MSGPRGLTHKMLVCQPSGVRQQQKKMVSIGCCCRQVDTSSGRDKQLAEAKAGKIKVKRDDALDKASAIEVAPLPKIEVRSSAAVTWLHQ